MGVSDSDGETSPADAAVGVAAARGVTDGRESGGIEATRVGGTTADSTMDVRGGGVDARTLANDWTGATGWEITCDSELGTVRVSEVSP